MRDNGQKLKEADMILVAYEQRIEAAKKNYLKFIEACQYGPVDFRLTLRAEPTGYARCFAVFGLHLLQEKDRLDAVRVPLVSALCNEIRSLRARSQCVPVDKPYRQLLTFTLSALAILDGLDENPLEELVTEQLPENVPQQLTTNGSLEGYAQSGNQAMFLAIFLLHARNRLDRDVTEELNQWTDLHIASMNRFGFWGAGSKMCHLYFQNGYHQYEIFEYLGITNPQILKAVAAVQTLADAEGHFAPYPGGGGCYDYDAVFVLTPDGKIPNGTTEKLLRQTANTLLAEQTPEGGWGESCYVRPRNPIQLGRFFYHVASALPNLSLFYERLRYAVALQRPKHNRIHTHWSGYSREWNEANLWDSWFRLLTVARIQTAIDPERAGEWGFIDYPGIGYHPVFESKLQK